MTDKSQLYLFSKGLGNIAQSLLEDDFIIAFKNIEYKINRILASFISPIITEKLLENTDYNRFDIDMDDSSFHFNHVIEALRGKEIELNDELRKFLSHIGEFLNNEELKNLSSKENIESFKYLSTLVDEVLTRKENNEDCKELIDKIAADYYRMELSQIERLPLDMLVELFESPKLLLLSENSHANNIISLISKNKPGYKILLSYIDYMNVSEDIFQSIREFLSDIEINEKILNAIKDRCIVRCEGIKFNDRYTQKEIPIPYIPDERLNGVFNFLRMRNDGKNPVDAGVVHLEQSTRDCTVPCKDLLNFGSKARWYLQEAEDSYLLFDFIKGRFALGAYTISSGASSSYWEYPVSWIFEGSNDKSTWTEIDKRSHNRDMGGNDRTFTWTCPLSPLFRYLRFRLKDVCRTGGLYCREFELFGAYLEPEHLQYS